MKKQENGNQDQKQSLGADLQMIQMLELADAPQKFYNKYVK